MPKRSCSNSSVESRSSCQRKCGKSLESMSPLGQRARRKIPGHRGPHNYLRDPMPRVQTDDAAQKIEIVRLFLERLDDFKRQEEQSLPLLRRFLARIAVELPKLRDEELSW